MKFLFRVRSVLTAAMGVALLLLVGSNSVFAATATTNFQITANVQANCVVSVQPMSFGNDTGGFEWATNGNITLTCSKGVNWSIGLNAGLGAGATVTDRKMTGPSSSVLNYGLFQDSSFSVNWGNTPGTDTRNGTSTGGAQHIVIFGNIPLAGQFATPGAYADTITATVTF